MKIALWIDKLRQPSSWNWMCEEKRVKSAWTWTKTYADSVHELGTGKYRYVSLNASFESADLADCGLNVSKWIAQEAEAGRLSRLTWYIHSALPYDQQMISYLEAASKSWDHKENIK